MAEALVLGRAQSKSQHPRCSSTIDGYLFQISFAPGNPAVSSYKATVPCTDRQPQQQSNHCYRTSNQSLHGDTTKRLQTKWCMLIVGVTEDSISCMSREDNNEMWCRNESTIDNNRMRGVLAGTKIVMADVYHHHVRVEPGYSLLIYPPYDILSYVTCMYALTRNPLETRYTRGHPCTDNIRGMTGADQIQG